MKLMWVQWWLYHTHTHIYRSSYSLIFTLFCLPLFHYHSVCCVDRSCRSHTLLSPSAGTSFIRLHFHAVLFVLWGGFFFPPFPHLFFVIVKSCKILFPSIHLFLERNIYLYIDLLPLYVFCMVRLCKSAWQKLAESIPPSWLGFSKSRPWKRMLYRQRVSPCQKCRVNRLHTSFSECGHGKARLKEFLHTPHNIYIYIVRMCVCI